MLENPCKTLDFKKNMVYKIPTGVGKPYLASGLIYLCTGILKFYHLHVNYHLSSFLWDIDKQ